MLTAFVGSAQPSGCRLQIGDPDVFRVAQLQGSLQQAALRGLLANRRDLSEAVFYYGDRLRPSLRGLLQDGEVGESAAWSLALIGEPEDVKAIIGSPPRPKKLAFASRWAYGVATSLLEPTSDSEWAFLQKCALNEFDDRWVDAGAIQTLKLIASPRSRELLEGAQRVNAYRLKSLTRALEYVDSGPLPLFGSDLQTLAEFVARTVVVGEWKGNSPARCNEMADKALVDFTFEAGMDRLTYTATFHKSDAVWKLRGVRETMQAFILRPTPVPTKSRR
jgi:hypothetical protein